ncbi:class C sortase [Corynebacterium sp. ES2775-CONJ]|uniref:class C sortase n=1 Tax=Corynebacterium sp. ES2775-CONJ TaxID=2974029 RepID=UPI0037BF92A6
MAQIAAHNDPKARSRNASPPKRSNIKMFLAVILILIGVGVLVYPVVATQWNNWQQQQAADEYAKLEKAAPPEMLDTAWEDALRYNLERTGNSGFTDAWRAIADETSPAYQQYLQYLSQLSDTDAMGQIMIPSIKSKLPIYHGTGPHALDRGVGHLFGTDLPIGGDNRHSVLSAHTGIQTATLWDNLINVKKGEVFYIAVSGHKLKYQVDMIKIVEPDHLDDLGRENGRDFVTLVTCTPYGINSHRLLVRGHRVPMDKNESKVFEASQIVWQWWMWALIAAAIIIILTLLAWLMKGTRRAGRHTAL